MENVSPSASSWSMRCSISLPAAISTLAGLKGDSPLAISSALTNWLQWSISGRIVSEAEVFPAPLHPAIMYNSFAIAKHVIYLNHLFVIGQ
jgi:hypothetical protein